MHPQAGGAVLFLCSAQHPRLSPGNVCTEPAGHSGVHVATDSCGRPEYLWRNNEGLTGDAYPLR